MTQVIKKIVVQTNVNVTSRDRFAQGPAKSIETIGKREKESTKCNPVTLPQLKPAALHSNTNTPFGKLNFVFNSD